MKKYGFFAGRFQPFHKEHLKVCLDILKKHEFLVVGITNPLGEYPPKLLSTITKKEMELAVRYRKPEINPWTYWQRYQMISRSLIKEGIDPRRFFIVPFFGPYDVTPEIEENILPPKKDTIFYHPIKDPHHKEIIEKYKKRGWEISIIDYEFNISATEVRRRIENNEDWEELVPEGTREVIKGKL